jgi:Zn-dependent protease with chaperone function
MRLQLVTTRDSYKCTESECDARKAFDMQVARLGYALADKAFELYPEVRERVPRFEFVIPEKSEPGTASNASGTIVIFSGTHALEPSDPALAFIVAREMGHVIAGHHNENSATKLVVSVLAQFLLPVTGVIRAFSLLPGASSAAAASATTASATAGGSTAVLAATATAASYLGAEALIATYWPKQLNVADAIALNLLARAGYHPQQVADALAAMEQNLGDSSWPRDLRASSMHVAEIAQGPRPDKERLAQIAGSAPVKLTYVAGESPAAELPARDAQALTR